MTLPFLSLFAVLLAMRLFVFPVNAQHQQSSTSSSFSSDLLDMFPTNIISVSPSLSSSSPSSSSPSPSPCALFVHCEHAMLRIHRRCTERSRKAISARCGLSAEFEELFRLSERRFDQFGACVTNEDEPNDGECSESEISSIGTLTTPSPDSGCWRSLAGLREQCQRLQQCCKSANGCMANISASDATMSLRAQHIKINRKTLQCRQTQHPIGPANSAGVDSSPISETEILSPGDIGPPPPAGPPAPPVSARLHSVLTASFLPRVVTALRREKNRPAEKNGRIGAIFEERKEMKTQRKITPSPKGRRNFSHRLSQFMADHRPTGIFLDTKTKKLRKSNTVPLISKQPQTLFALPNQKLRRLKLYSARSHINSQWKQQKERSQQLLIVPRQNQTENYKNELLKNENSSENDWIFWQKWPRKGIRGLTAIGNLASQSASAPHPSLFSHFVPFSGTFPPPNTVIPLSPATTVLPSFSANLSTKTVEVTTKKSMRIAKLSRKNSLRLSQLYTRAKNKKVFRTSVLRMIAHRQPKGFALPSRLDFHRMRLFAARPDLSRSFALAAQRRVRFWHLRNRTDAFGRDKKQTEGAKAAEKDRIGLSQIEAELSLSLPPSSSSPTTPLPLAHLSSLTSLAVPFSVTPAAMFPQIWTRPYPRGPNAWGELEAQLSTPQEMTATIGTTTKEMAKHQQQTQQSSDERPNGTSDDVNETKLASKTQSVAETSETKVMFQLARQGKDDTEDGHKKGEKEEEEKNGEEHMDKFDTTNPTTSPETTTPQIPTQRFGGKSRSSGRVRSRVHGVVPKHVGETRRERPKMAEEMGKMRAELAGNKNGRVRLPSLHSSSDGHNSLDYREKKPLLPSSIRRSPTKKSGNRRPSTEAFLNHPSPKPLTFFTSDTNEMNKVGELLARHLEKHLTEKQQGGDNGNSHSPRSSSSNHCHLFVSCMLLLRRLQSDQCHSSPAADNELGRPVPGPPRRRFGRCNARLLPLFERVDSARAELERGAEKCLEENVRNGTARSKGSCPSELSNLRPHTISLHSECSERIALLHQHCKKLGRCCETLESCQNRIGTSGLARRVRLEEQKLAVRSTQCQMQAQEMFRIFREKQKTNEELLGAKRRRKMMSLLL